MVAQNRLAILPLAMAAPSIASLNCSEDTFVPILRTIPSASLNFVTWVPQNGTFGDATPGIGNANASHLPELCGLSVNIQTPGNTSYNFGLFLPKTWNERLMAVGNGGFGGGVNWPDMARHAHYGFASVSTDTGHISRPDDASWGLHQPEKLINWGHRAMHGSVAAAKEIVQNYYAEAISFSYFSSCSNGGRQGLKEVQLYPDTFDGVIVGAPGWQPTHLSAWMVRQGLLNSVDNTAGRIEAELLKEVVKEMIRQCDPQDGVVDDIINDPFGCNFDFNKLLCPPGSHGRSCLTGQQLETAEMLYTSYWESDQTLVHPSISLGTDAAPISTSLTGLGTGLYRYWVRNDSNWDATSISFEDVKEADRIDPGQAGVNELDLIPFHHRGGKLLVYHGQADPLIPSYSSVQLYNNLYRTLKAQGVDISELVRFYLIPGMSHCFGSPVAPSIIGASYESIHGSTHSVPGFKDSKHDIVLAMMDWVENGIAPQEIIATKFKNDATGNVERQRPLCPYPAQAQFEGGEVNRAESWRCKTFGDQ